jgi:osmotically-inducible protein OsmY
MKTRKKETKNEKNNKQIYKERKLRRKKRGKTERKEDERVTIATTATFLLRLKADSERYQSPAEISECTLQGSVRDEEYKKEE